MLFFFIPCRLAVLQQMHFNTLLHQSLLTSYQLLFYNIFVLIFAFYTNLKMLEPSEVCIKDPEQKKIPFEFLIFLIFKLF